MVCNGSRLMGIAEPCFHSLGLLSPYGPADSIPDMSGNLCSVPLSVSELARGWGSG